MHFKNTTFLASMSQITTSGSMILGLSSLQRERILIFTQQGLLSGKRNKMTFLISKIMDWRERSGRRGMKWRKS